MPNRVGFLVLSLAGLAICWLQSKHAVLMESVVRGLPGGTEGLPGGTVIVLGVLVWFASWWPLCIGLVVAVFLFVPKYLERSEDGRRLLEWLRNNHVVLAMIFGGCWILLLGSVDHLIHRPFLSILYNLTGP